MQQQLADATVVSEQQKQSHRHTLSLLDQAHLQQLSQLQNQLHAQVTDHSAADAQLRSQLAEQTELTQQLRHGMSDLQHKIQTLQRTSAEDQAVVKMLLKQQAAAEADAEADAEANAPPSVQLQHAAPSNLATINYAPQEKSALEPQPGVQIPTPSVCNSADRTLILEADVLRKECRVLRDTLAKAEAAVQSLTHAQHEAEQRSSAKLSELEGMLSQLEGKHMGSATLLDQTVAAMQNRTSLLLQQRLSGNTYFPW